MEPWAYGAGPPRAVPAAVQVEPTPQTLPEGQSHRPVLPNAVLEELQLNIRDFCDHKLAPNSRKRSACKLMDYARSHPRVAQLFHKRAMEPAASFLHPHHALVKEAAGLVANMALNQWHRQLAGASGKPFQTMLAGKMVRPIVEMLAVGMEPDVETELLRALWNLSWRNNDAALVIVKCEPSILHIVKRLNGPHATLAAGVLWSLGRLRPVADAIFQAKGVPALMDCLSRPDTELQWHAMCALGMAVFESADCHSEALALGCVGRLAAFMDAVQVGQVDKVWLDLASKAAETLTFLCFDKPDAQRAFTEGNHMQKLISFLKAAEEGRTASCPDLKKLLMLILAVCYNNLPQQIVFAETGGLRSVRTFLSHPNMNYVAGLTLSTLCYASPLVRGQLVAQLERDAIPSQDALQLIDAQCRARFEEMAVLRNYVYAILDDEKSMLELLRLLEPAAPQARPTAPQEHGIKVNVGLMILSQICCPLFPQLQRRFFSVGGLGRVADSLADPALLHMATLALIHLVAGPMAGPPDLGFQGDESSRSNADICDSVVNGANLAVPKLLCRSLLKDETFSAASAALASLVRGDPKLLHSLNNDPEVEFGAIAAKIKSKLAERSSYQKPSAMPPPGQPQAR